MTTDIILEMRNITKTFPGVKALEQCEFASQGRRNSCAYGRERRRQVHAHESAQRCISTWHIHRRYLFKGKVCEFKDITQSEQLGIVIIHQELALIPQLSISENIFLGNEQSRRGIINWNETIIKTRDLLQTVGLNESPNTLVSMIGVGKQQLVEIAKALSKKVKLLILDEPTAALNEEDSENLLNLLLEFKKQGISSIMISHKLNEITKVADSITILRDGHTIETLDMVKDSITEDRIIKGMVGRDLTQRYPVREPNIGDMIFEVKDWNVYHPYAAGAQGDRRREFEYPQGRNRRNCRAYGSRTNGACDEPIRQVLRKTDKRRYDSEGKESIS